MLHYFAYGSNMSTRRMLQRIPQAVRLTTAVLKGHTLVFHKRGRDGSAKCDAFYTKRSSDRIYGVIYQIPQEHLPILNAFEGLGKGYEIARALVELPHGSSDRSEMEVFFYQATDIDPKLKPFKWYKVHVLRGALENRFPAEYCEKIKRVPAILDPNRERMAKELSIYRHR
ncbi:MAG: gamma-glutamylcyclotransferase [Thermodesulfobacteria bacterium]|nr:gamma-glutamylcyclotransferase [Thermodesulfobacteriota bacterium]